MNKTIRIIVALALTAGITAFAADENAAKPAKPAKTAKKARLRSPTAPSSALKLSD